MNPPQTGRSWNPVTAIGAVVLGATVGLSLLLDPTAERTIVQAILPTVVGLGMILYGLRMGAVSGDQRQAVLLWLVTGTIVFLGVGAFFATISRRYETTFELAMLGSLAAGSLFGTVVGVYAARLRQANERLRRKSDRMEEFAAIVSHDLRNPLNVAQGRVDLALEERDDEHLRAADGALDRMESLIADLLTLAQEETLVRHIEGLSLSALAERSWSSVVDEATSPASLVLESEVEVAADPDRFQQLLENLFRNAVTHAGPDVTVTVGAIADDGFYVADDGPGIPADAREDLFEGSYRSETSGTGLGLQIVTRIADAHGWDVAVAESSAGGARFEFRGTAPDDQA